MNIWPLGGSLKNPYPHGGFFQFDFFSLPGFSIQKGRVCITVMINLVFMQIKCMIFHMYIYILYLLRVYYKFLTMWPAPRWLDTVCSSVGRALHQYCRGHGFKSGLKFFRLNFHKCLSCVYNCNDQSCLHIFLHCSNVYIFFSGFNFTTI